MDDKEYQCACCEKYTIIEIDNFEVCPVCGWEDDGVQRDNPEYPNGANRISLNQAKEAYKKKLEANN